MPGKKGRSGSATRRIEWYDAQQLIQRPSESLLRASRFSTNVGFPLAPRQAYPHASLLSGAGPVNWRRGRRPIGALFALYLALNLARTRVHGRQSWSLAGKTGEVERGRETLGAIGVSRAQVQGKAPLSRLDNGRQSKRVIGFEPTTFTFATPKAVTLRSSEVPISIGSPLPPLALRADCWHLEPERNIEADPNT